MLNRREALIRLIAATGGIVGAEFLISGCARLDKRRRTEFTAEDLALLDEIAETIIPATDTPGARAAGVGAFMALVVNDCYDDETHVVFERGLDAVDKASRGRHGKPFMASTPAERTALLGAIDAEARAHESTKRAGEPPHYFRLMRELAIIGYFSSEIGSTQALRYIESPGAYRGDEPYAQGDRHWYNPSRRLG
jgi:hypothetical protein